MFFVLARASRRPHAYVVRWGSDPHGLKPNLLGFINSCMDFHASRDHWMLAVPHLLDFIIVVRIFDPVVRFRNELSRFKEKLWGLYVVVWCVLVWGCCSWMVWYTCSSVFASPYISSGYYKLSGDNDRIVSVPVICWWIVCLCWLCEAIGEHFL